MVIYSINTGKIKLDIGTVFLDSKRKFELMKEDYIEIKFNTARPYHFGIGDYTYFKGCRYEIVEPQVPEYDIATGGFKHTIKFYAEYYKWKNKIFKYTPQLGGQEAEWTLTQTLDKHLEVVLKNLEHHGFMFHNANGDELPYKLYIDESVQRKPYNITYSNQNILDALTDMAKKWECDWWVHENFICFGAVEFDFAKKDEYGEYINTVDFRVGDNVESVNRRDAKVQATRVYAFGSTKNVPPSYRKHLIFELSQKDGNTISDPARPLEHRWFDNALYGEPKNVNIACDKFTEFTREYNKNNTNSMELVDHAKTLKMFDYTLLRNRKIGMENGNVLLTMGNNGSGSVRYHYTSTVYQGTTYRLAAVDIKYTVYGLPKGEVNRIELGTATEHLTGNSITHSGSGEYAVSYAQIPNTTQVQLAPNEKMYDDAETQYSVSVVAIPTFDYLDADGNVKANRGASYQVNFSFVNTVAWAFSHPFYMGVVDGNLYPSISVNIIYKELNLKEHRYDMVGQSKGVINAERDFAHSSVITVDDEPPKEATHFSIEELEEWRVPVWMLTSDAMLYGESDEYVLNGIAKRNLMLPLNLRFGEKGEDVEGDYTNMPYIESEEGHPEEFYVEQVLVLDDVFPRTKSVVTNVHERLVEVTHEDDGSTEKVPTYYLQSGWQIVAGCDEWGNEILQPYKDFVFKQDYILEAEHLEITFTSGLLNGMTFEVAFYDNGHEVIDGLPEGTQLWGIKQNTNYGYNLPNTLLRPQPNDEYVLTGWNSSAIKDMGLVEYAERELLIKANLWLKDAMKDPSNYECTMMSNVMQKAIGENGIPEQEFPLGTMVRLNSDANFPEGSRITHIIGYEYKMDFLYDNVKITLGEKPTTSRLSKIEGKVETVIKGGYALTGGGNGNGGYGNAAVYLIRRNDNTIPLESNTFSALRILDDFLRKNAEDVARERIQFEKGVTIGLDNIYGFLGNGDISANDIKSRNIEATEVKSPVFSSGQLGTGFRIGYDANGMSLMEIDNLLVRYAAQFTTITYNRLEFIAGNRVLSCAGGEIAAVENVTDSEGNTAYKCYLNLTDNDGNLQAENVWRCGDQARCQMSDIPEQNVSYETKSYWRKVIETGDDYIVLSGTDCASVNDSIPQAGDRIVQLGNGKYTDLDGKDHNADVNRQSAIMFEVNGGDAPAIKQFASIDDYNLDNNIVTQISPKGNLFTGTFKIHNTSGETEVLKTEVISQRQVRFKVSTDFTAPATPTTVEEFGAWTKTELTPNVTNPYLWQCTQYTYTDGSHSWVVAFSYKWLESGDTEYPYHLSLSDLAVERSFDGSNYSYNPSTINMQTLQNGSAVTATYDISVESPAWLLCDKANRMYQSQNASMDASMAVLSYDAAVGDVLHIKSSSEEGTDYCVITDKPLNRWGDFSGVVVYSSTEEDDDTDISFNVTKAGKYYVTYGKDSSDEDGEDCAYFWVTDVSKPKDIAPSVESLVKKELHTGETYTFPTHKLIKKLTIIAKVGGNEADRQGVVVWSDGKDGIDGANATEAYYYTCNNEAHTLMSKDSLGTPASLEGSDCEIRVFKGNTELVYDSRYENTEFTIRPTANNNVDRNVIFFPIVNGKGVLVSPLTGITIGKAEYYRDFEIAIKNTDIKMYVRQSFTIAKSGIGETFVNASNQFGTVKLATKEGKDGDRFYVQSPTPSVSVQLMRDGVARPMKSVTVTSDFEGLITTLASSATTATIAMDASTYVVGTGYTDFGITHYLPPTQVDIVVSVVDENDQTYSLTLPVSVDYSAKWGEFIHNQNYFISQIGSYDNQDGEVLTSITTIKQTAESIQAIFKGLGENGITINQEGVHIFSEGNDIGTFTVKTKNFILNKEGDVTVMGDVTCKSLEYLQTGYSDIDKNSDNQRFVVIKNESFVIVPHDVNYIRLPCLDAGHTREIIVFKEMSGLMSWIPTFNESSKLNNTSSDESGSLQDGEKQEIVEVEKEETENEFYEHTFEIDNGYQAITAAPTLDVFCHKIYKGVRLYQNGVIVHRNDSNQWGVAEDVQLVGVGFKFLGVCPINCGTTYWTVHSYDSQSSRIIIQ